MNNMFPVSPDLALNYFKAAVQGFDYLARTLDQYEREQRYDDNAQKLLEQAYRMYECGRLSKTDLMKIIQIMPENLGQSETINFGIIFKP